ncbi:MAG: secretin N-terminal domain-containing protein [Myxococcota bacterium]
MARISLMLLFMAISEASIEAPKPLSNLNLEGFKQTPSEDIWERNPFAQEEDDIDLKKPKLTMIVLGKDTSAALISGRGVRVKDKIGSAQVVSIKSGEVILRTLGGLTRLRLEGTQTKSRQSGLYSVEIKEAPLGDAIKLLATLQNKNVVMPSKLEDIITASFPQISLAGAMQALLESRGLTADDRNTVVRIVTQKEQEALGGDLLTRVFPLKYAKAKEIKEQATALISARGTVMVDERTNSLTMRDTPNYIKNMQTFIESIDYIDKQVLIEARVVEASTKFVQSFGVQWGVKVDTTNFRMDGVPGTNGSAGPQNTTGITGASGTTTGATTDNTTSTGSRYINTTRAVNPLAALAIGIPFTNAALDFELSAAENDNKVTILSRPSIITMNNQPATIHSGSKVFLQVPAAVGVGAGGQLGAVGGLQNISAGITMVVTPQITIDGKIRLLIDVTSSQFDASSIGSSQVQVFDNNAKTQILLEDGQTTVLGGLYQSSNSKSKGGIPFLARLPLIGALFRNSTNAKDKRELLVFIKPKIVQSALQELDRTEREAVNPIP